MKADFTVLGDGIGDTGKLSGATLADGRDTRWERFRRGDRNAFEAIYLDNFDGLYEYGMYLVRDRELVKDTLHDLFELLWNKRETLGTIKSIDSYLFVSFRRNLLTAQKKLGKHLKLVADIPTGEATMAETEQREEAEHAQQLHHLLQRALEDLTPKQREILTLKFHSRLSHQQVSEVMGIKKGDVYYHFSKAMEQLSVVLSRYL